MTCAVTAGRLVGGERQCAGVTAENVVALRAEGPARGKAGIPAQPGAANSPACATILLVFTMFESPSILPATRKIKRIVTPVNKDVNRTFHVKADY